MYHLIAAVTVGPIRRSVPVRSTGRSTFHAKAATSSLPTTLESRPLAAGAAALPDRQLRFMAKSELYGLRSTGSSTAAGAFPVRRGTGDEEAMRTAIELAQAGEVVAIFPEGTRRNKGSKKRKPRPRSGAARVALLAGVPLVPAAIGGTESLLKLGPLRVAYGPPVELADLKEMDVRRASQSRDRAADGGDPRASRRRCESRCSSSTATRWRTAPTTRCRRRSATKAAGNAVVGFTNMLVRLWEMEEPRAVFVGWDTLTVPTYRHEALRGLPGRPRVRRLRCSSSSTCFPSSSRRSASRAAKAPGFEADDFLAAAVASGGEARRARGGRDLRPRLVPARQRADDGRHAGARRLRAGPDRPGRGARALRRRAGAGAGLHRPARRPLRQAARRARGRAEDRGVDSRTSTARSRPRSRRAAFRSSGRTWSSTGELRRSTPPLLSLPSKIRPQPGRRRPPSSAAGA